MRFLSDFGCKIIFMCSVNFWHQQDSNPLFKGAVSRNSAKLGNYKMPVKLRET